MKEIIAIKDFQNVKTGDVGGFIENEKNLSHIGNAWVSKGAAVSGDAQVFGNAYISGNSHIFGHAFIYGDAKVDGNAKIYGGSKIYDNAKINGDAIVRGYSEVYGNALISGDAVIESSTICDACINEDVFIYEDMKIYGLSYLL